MYFYQYRKCTLEKLLRDMELDELVSDYEYEDIMNRISDKEQWVKLLNYFNVISVRHLTKRQYQEAIKIFELRNKNMEEKKWKY